MKKFFKLWSGKMDSQQLDRILWRHLSSLPYFRGFLRAVEDRFYQEIDLPNPILDLGSGDGHFASVAFTRKPTLGLDPWFAPTREAQARGAYKMLVLGEGARIPVASCFFGSVISTSVLEHIPAVEPVIEEVARVLKPEGKFVFCVPNHRFPQELWGRKVFASLGLRRLGDDYSKFFNRLARHAHTDSPDVWESRLEQAGFELEDTWDYFPPQALKILEWGHPLGLPAWVCKKLFGRWVLVSKRWNLIVPWRMTRKYLDHPRSDQGVCSFFIARKRL